MAIGALADAKKGAAREGRTIVWVDESGFALLPATVRSLAPRGHPPTLRFPVTHEHLSVISGITPNGRLLLHVQDHAYRSPDIVQFLRHLLRAASWGPQKPLRRASQRNEGAIEQWRTERWPALEGLREKAARLSE